MEKTASPKPVPQAVADQIIERLSAGEPLAQICRDEGTPALRTVYDWMERDEAFRTRIARAREAGYDQIATSTLDIADDANEDPQRSKLRIWTRLELLKRWDPKRYGERVLQEHTGADGGPIAFAEVKRSIVDPKVGK